MRVLHVNSCKNWGGAELQVLLLMNGQRAAGDEVALVCHPQSPLAARARATGHVVMQVALGPSADPRGALRLRGEIENFRPEVVHAHTVQSHGHARRALLGHSPPRPLLVVSRYGAQTIHWHGLISWSRRKYVHGVDHILCGSDAARRQLWDDGIPNAMLSVVHCGLPETAFDPLAPAAEARAAFGEAHPRLLTVGALTPDKGHDLMLDVVKALLPDFPRLRWVIIGEGKQRRALHARIDALGLGEHVTLAGFVAFPQTWMPLADLVVHPARREDFSVSVLEAMAQERAIITSGVGGIAEALRKDVDARFVADFEASAWVTAIRELLRDDAERMRLGTSASERAAQAFSGDAMVARTRERYFSVLSARGTLGTVSNKLAP